MSIQVEHYTLPESSHAQQVKQWLCQARWLELQSDAKKEQIARLRARVNSCMRSVSASSGSGKTDWTETIAKLTTLEKQINVDIDRLILRNGQIRCAVAQLPEAEQRIVIELRYLNGYSWNRIARTTNWSRSSVFRHHDAALENIRIPEN